MSEGGPAARPLMVVGHPGHELRLHHWLETARPTVVVLTDGSGSDGVSRLPSTSAALEGVRAVPGAIYGRLTDAAMYQALLEHRFEVFAALVTELTDFMVSAGVETVVGDRAEGYNP